MADCKTKGNLNKTAGSAARPKGREEKNSMGSMVLVIGSNGSERLDAQEGTTKDLVGAGEEKVGEAGAVGMSGRKLVEKVAQRGKDQLDSKDNLSQCTSNSGLHLPNFGFELVDTVGGDKGIGSNGRKGTEMDQDSTWNKVQVSTLPGRLSRQHSTLQGFFRAGWIRKKQGSMF